MQAARCWRRCLRSGRLPQRMLQRAPSSPSFDLARSKCKACQSPFMAHGGFYWRAVASTVPKPERPSYFTRILCQHSNVQPACQSDDQLLQPSAHACMSVQSYGCTTWLLCVVILHYCFVRTLYAQSSTHGQCEVAYTRSDNLDRLDPGH